MSVDFNEMEIFFNHDIYLLAKPSVLTPNFLCVWNA